METKTIRLGLCLAGAVSAGAYTAGVMDYFIETLERWEKEKEKIRTKLKWNEELTEAEIKVPLHDVVIEIISGASAGGMTGAILGYSFCDNTYYNKINDEVAHFNYTIPDHTFQKSKLYQSWIEMMDDDKKGISTLEKLLDVSDLKKEKFSLWDMKSFLNSQVIDDIAKAAVPKGSINYNPPNFISKNLNLLLSVTNVQGVPIDIKFANISQDNPTRNVLRMHSGFLHYTFSTNTHIDINCDFPSDTLCDDNKEYLSHAAMATGAFPFGLKNRIIHVSHDYFLKFKQNLLDKYKMDVAIDPQGKPYSFTAVDGGAINNEPLGTVVKLMQSKIKNYHQNDKAYYILVDPFPNITNATSIRSQEEVTQNNLKDLVFKLIGTFRNQSMFKQEDILSALDMDRSRFLIYPSKRGFYFLASGLISGFSGFFKKSFREHDYQLGRKNCQTFLRYYFGNEFSDFESETGISLNAEQKRIFAYDSNYKIPEKNKNFRFPYIPDLLLLEHKREEEIPVPIYNGLSIEEFKKINRKIEERLKMIVDNTYPSIITQIKKQSKIAGFASSLFSSYIKRNIYKRINAPITEFLNNTFKPQCIKQEELMVKYSDFILKHGKPYYKIKGVYAKAAESSQEIKSVIGGKTETVNYAGKGDYIIKNDTDHKEKYILLKDQFDQRYIPDGNETDHDGYLFYRPVEIPVHAIQLTADNIEKYNLTEFYNVLDPRKEAHIEAQWNQSMLVTQDDYLVLAFDESGIYRIEKEVFKETYQPA
ncbi:patatin-like phospholipase family protein [Chryseobacterium candidae]|uniref:PNPLA domain-containing protein n=1 Tax=Chryseobacterium candidae TaxID=1978493 RepID=A0ABY2R2B4_9FLAO|nr:patatin-like phospholipase family protein [Chryseobacterium candidae]THV56462.1 hypothetical protein EK417_19020 [Chryseobacterium candidae]